MLWVCWLIAGDGICRAVDALFTITVKVSSPSFIVSTHEGLIMNLEITDVDQKLTIQNFVTNALCSLEMDGNSNVFCIVKNASFKMGSSVANPKREFDWQAHSVRPDSLDCVTLKMSRSSLFWKEPFKMNFMTGHMPDRYRFVYYCLQWQKATGQTLTINWRFIQEFWAGSGWSQGLSAPDISPKYDVTSIEIADPRAHLQVP